MTWKAYLSNKPCKFFPYFADASTDIPSTGMLIQNKY